MLMSLRETEVKLGLLSHFPVSLCESDVACVLLLEQSRCAWLYTLHTQSAAVNEAAIRRIRENRGAKGSHLPFTSSELVISAEPN